MKNNIFISILILLVLGTGGYLALNKKQEVVAPTLPDNNSGVVTDKDTPSKPNSGSIGGSTTEEPIFCTMDAMMCPDGSYVGRTGPKCEFVCPKVDPSQKGEYTFNNASAEQIIVSLPFPGAVVGKNFSVTGKARGMWYFEATFPIDVLDKNGKILAQGYAKAEGDWMTEEYVPFKGDIKIPQSYTGPATLVIKRNNASDLPENDASVKFDITVEY